MTKTSKFALSVLTAGAMALAPAAHAAMITGSITFTGGVVTDNNGDVGASSKVTAWTGVGGVGNPSVLTVSGDFVPAGRGASPGTTVAFHAPWSYNSGAIGNFWQVGNFTFNLTSSVVVSEVAGVGVLVSGTGMITDTVDGFAATGGTWTFSASDPAAGTSGGNPVFSFQAASGAVPDAGATAILLGLGLTSIALFAKFRKQIA